MPYASGRCARLMWRPSRARQVIPHSCGLVVVGWQPLAERRRCMGPSRTEHQHYFAPAVGLGSAVIRREGHRRAIPLDASGTRINCDRPPTLLTCSPRCSSDVHQATSAGGTITAARGDTLPRSRHVPSDDRHGETSRCREHECKPTPDRAPEKKSVALSTARWIRMNSFQVMVFCAPGRVGCHGA